MDIQDNHFALFGLPERFGLDAAALDRAYRDVQARVHPDRFAGAGAAEQRVALQWATRVNEAYRVLRDPLRRAIYLCALRGQDPADEHDTRMAQPFLIQQLEWREALDAARADHDSTKVEALHRELSEARDALKDQVERALDAEDDVGEAATRVRQWMFVERFGDDVAAVFRANGDALMALLQISEPGMAPAPHQRRLAVGIDLGTTNSLVAAVRNGVAEVLPDEHGRALLPSAVHYRADGTAGIGHDALAQRAADPRNTIVSVKRLMGRGRDEIDAAGMRYDLADAPSERSAGDTVRLRTAAGVKTPVEVSAEILATLRQRAEDTLGDDLVGAVITVPAYFDDAQRQATKDAAQLAGLNVLRLLNEPTAAAVAYGLDNGIEGTYAVYDLGGGTFDVSILRLTHGVFEVLATGGDTSLGGDDFDARLADLAMRAAGVTADALDDAEHARLAAHARAAKEELSDALIVDVAFEAGDVHRHAAISRTAFADATADLVDRTIAAATRGLRDARLTPSDIVGVVMVGGATRMPHVRAAVGRYFGKPPLIDLDPDRVVALGAAMQAHALAGNRAAAGDEWLLLDVIPLSLGVETMGGLAEKIIARNSTIPVARAQEFTTFKDGQTAMAIHVVQGERELVSDCRSLARFELRGIPPMTAGAARIRVTYQVDADGLLSVSAREVTSNVEAHIAVKPSYGLGDDEVARMLQDSFGAADSDMRVRALREQQVEAERIVAATDAALAADAALLDDAERDRIRCQIDAVRRVAGGDDHHAIKDAIDALSHGTERFAELRMDASVRRALTGKRLDEIA